MYESGTIIVYLKYKCNAGKSAIAAPLPVHGAVSPTGWTLQNL